MSESVEPGSFAAALLCDLKYDFHFHCCKAEIGNEAECYCTDRGGKERHERWHSQKVARYLCSLQSAFQRNTSAMWQREKRSSPDRYGEVHSGSEEWDRNACTERLQELPVPWIWLSFVKSWMGGGFKISKSNVNPHLTQIRKASTEFQASPIRNTHIHTYWFEEPKVFPENPKKKQQQNIRTVGQKKK